MLDAFFEVSRLGVEPVHVSLEHLRLLLALRHRTGG